MTTESNEQYRAGFEADKLEPCPFCGSIHLQSYSHGSTEEPDNYVQCMGCTTTGPFAWTPDEAVKRWNNRPVGKREASTEPSVATWNSAIEAAANAVEKGMTPDAKSDMFKLMDVEARLCADRIRRLKRYADEVAGALPDEAPANPWGWVTPDLDRLILASWYGPGVTPQVEGMLPVYVGTKTGSRQ